MLFRPFGNIICNKLRQDVFYTYLWVRTCGSFLLKYIGYDGVSGSKFESWVNWRDICLRCTWAGTLINLKGFAFTDPAVGNTQGLHSDSSEPTGGTLALRHASDSSSSSWSAIAAALTWCTFSNTSRIWTVYSSTRVERLLIIWTALRRLSCLDVTSLLISWSCKLRQVTLSKQILKINIGYPMIIGK